MPLTRRLIAARVAILVALVASGAKLCVDDEAVKAAAIAEENVQRFIGDKPVRKVIFVPGKLVNVVV